MIVMHSLRDYDSEKSAGRMAVQAAAGALMSVTGHTCEDIVMCSTSREWDDMLEVSPLQHPNVACPSHPSGMGLNVQNFQFVWCFWPCLVANTALLDWFTLSL